jgi:hypothetical protein
LTLRRWHCRTQPPRPTKPNGAVKELGMPVVVIGTNVRGRNLDMPEFLPFFSRMNDLTTPIIIHSDGLSPYQNYPAAGDRTGWFERGPFSADYPVWWMLTHPFEHRIAIARIIYSGPLSESPVHSWRKAPVTLGRVFDLTYSYRSAFALTMVCAVVGMLATLGCASSSRQTESLV